MEISVAPRSHVTLLLLGHLAERVNLNHSVDNTMTDAAEQRRIVVLISGSGLYATSAFIPTHTPRTTVRPRRPTPQGRIFRLSSMRKTRPRCPTRASRS